MCARAHASPCRQFIFYACLGYKRDTLHHLLYREGEHLSLWARLLCVRAGPHAYHHRERPAARERGPTFISPASQLCQPSSCCFPCFLPLSCAQSETLQGCRETAIFSAMNSLCWMQKEPAHTRDPSNHFTDQETEARRHRWACCLHPTRV